MAETGKFAPRLFIGWLSGLCLAVLAFSQAAASAGLAIDGFRPLGAGFFSWRAGQMRLSIKIFESDNKASAERAISVGRSTLRLAPLTPRSLWLIGRGLEIQGDFQGARRAIRQAERVSRRDGVVEFWLGEDNLRRGKIALGFRNFDLMMRGDYDAASKILPRLSMIILAPEGRHYLSPYIREDNPWMPSLMQAAMSNLPRAKPLATLLIDRGKKAPDVETLRPVYAALMTKLIDERAFRQALRLYPLLPDADPASLRDMGGIGGGKLVMGYPPFIWDFPDSSDRGGSVVGVAGGSGLDIFGSPGTVGVAASKLVEPRGAVTLNWRIDDRTANVQSEAIWEATCLMGRAVDDVRRSANLLNNSIKIGQVMKMPVPENCDLLYIKMLVAGGIGRTPAGITVSNLKLSDGKRKPLHD